MDFLANIKYFISRIWDVMENTYARIGAALIWVISFFSPVWYPFLVVLIMIGIDLYWGLRAAHIRHQLVLSEAGRRTVDKITSYLSCLAAVYLIEHIILENSIVVTSGIAALASACELWSFSASILIIHPNFPFIRMFRKQLRGEIESKAHISLEDLDKIYAESEFDRSPWGTLKNVHRQQQEPEDAVPEGKGEEVAEKNKNK